VSQSLDRYRNTQGKIWVNVASSVYVLEEFVNIDNHLFMRFLGLYPIVRFLVPKRYRPTFEQYREARAKAMVLRRDCRRPLPFPDGSVDHILCSHFLEHVFREEAVAILKDFRRALKPGGTAHIIVPDIRAMVDEYLRKSAAGEAGAADWFVGYTLLSLPKKGTYKYRVMEFGGGFGLQHRWMYDTPSMAAAMKEAGFSLIEGNDTPSQTYRENDGSVHLVGRAE
jgi:predicted SAM-dependent methyltransferase